MGQTIAPGQTYDESNPGDEPLKVQVIGTVLDWKGKTGKEFENELAQMGFTQHSIDSEEVADPKAEWKIQKVIAYKLDEQGERTGETADWFRLDAGDVQLNIIVEKPYVQKPDAGQKENSGSGISSSGGGQADTDGQGRGIQ